MKAPWVAGALLIAAACSTFSTADDAPSTIDGGVDADAGKDAGLPLCDAPDFRGITLDDFNPESPTTTLDAGVLQATANNVDDGGSPRARMIYGPPSNTYAFELDYDLEIGGVTGIDMESGCTAVVHHPLPGDPYTEVYFVQQPARDWYFKVTQYPQSPVFMPFEKNLATLGAPSVTHVHTRVDLRNGSVAGYGEWAGTQAKFDRAIGYVFDSVNFYCGVHYVDFKGTSISNVSVKISKFTGYVCIP